MSQKKEPPQAQGKVDVTDVVCPMTFVKTKVALDDLDPGQILSIRINDGEPIRNVPQSLKEDGHLVLGLNDNGDGTYELVVKKGQDR
ncbi:MAG: sulfurtransferase TusA family protein [Deltaproteobacteria bacterium]|nr:sulfurtransferase TusA family protein [Deltaproteobacteria bacterium]